MEECTKEIFVQQTGERTKEIATKHSNDNLQTGDSTEENSQTEENLQTGERTEENPVQQTEVNPIVLQQTEENPVQEETSMQHREDDPIVLQQTEETLEQYIEDDPIILQQTEKTLEQQREDNPVVQHQKYAAKYLTLHPIHKYRLKGFKTRPKNSSNKSVFLIALYPLRDPNKNQQLWP